MYYYSRKQVRVIVKIMKKSGEFSLRVYEAVKKIPCGKVASYKQIALMCGNINASRAVGNALHANPKPGEIPCHRVVNSFGFLAKDFAFGGVNEQAKLLRAEGINVEQNRVVTSRDSRFFLNPELDL